MIISPDALRKDTVALIGHIDKQIAEVNNQAAAQGIEGHQLQDTNGNWVMGPLLLAKAMAYSTLVALQTKK